MGPGVTTPKSWSGDNRPKLRVCVVESGAHFDLSVVGYGVARWVAGTLRLAARQLAAGRLEVLNKDSSIVDNPNEARQIAFAARDNPEGCSALRLAPRRDRRGVYLVDEPEQALHPAAIESVREWLGDLAREAGTVVVATHHPRFLDLPTKLGGLVLLARNDGGSASPRTITKKPQTELGAFSKELGLRPSDLLLLTRLVLFVEGPHDVAVLSEMFGEELDTAGVRVFPVHGTHNLLSLVDSEVIAALGIPIAILTDNTNQGRVRRGESWGDEERHAARLIKEMKLAKRDIVEYLSDEICKRHATGDFPGWKDAKAAWKDRGQKDFKRWVCTEYGLKLERDDVRKLAHECRLEGHVPQELREKMREVVTLADSGTPRMGGSRCETIRSSSTWILESFSPSTVAHPHLRELWP